MRGLFTAGILDVFMENDLTFDGAIGVSAGALFGCNLKSHQPGRAVRYNVKYCRDKRFVSFLNLIFTGNIFGVDFCYRRIPFELDIWDHKAFAENPMEFYAVCTDVETGEPFYYKCTDGMEGDIKYFRASGSMPLVSKVVEIDGRKFLDGGVSDAIPLKKFQKLGYDRIVVIQTRPEEYRKEPTKLMPLIKLKYGKKYPELVKDMESRHLMYNAELDYISECEENGSIYVIRPKKDLRISQTAHDPEELKRVYKTGRYTAKKLVDEVKAWLQG